MKGKILLVAINAKYIHSNPAVYSLYSYAKEWRESIEVVEYTINQKQEEILADLYGRQPKMIAFSCYIWNIHVVEELLSDIPKVLPDVDLWLGGPEVSFDASKRLASHPCLTGIVVGEGEETFAELVGCYVKGSANPEHFSHIAGLCLPGQDRETGAFYTGTRGMTDLDSIPFFYEELGLERFENRIIYYESSRGCPFRCSYCLSSIDKQVRLRSLDLVLPELQFFLNHKVKQVKFIDRTFNCNREHAMAIWKYLLEHDNGVTNFHFEVAADIMTEEEMSVIKQMRPGLIQLEIGVQSTNRDTIAEIRRVMDLDKVHKNVDTVKSFGNTHQHLDLIAGLPYEDYESFQRSFNEVFVMRPDQLQLGFLKVLKGSHMEEMAEAYEIRHHSAPPYEVLSTKWISYEEIQKLKQIEEMVELFYNSGQFTATLAVLETRFETPFAMFSAMAEFYEKHDYYVHVPARSYRYSVVFAFAAEYMPEVVEVVRQTLTYDLYLRENCKSRAEFALDLTPWKDDIRERTVDKQDHMDVFTYPVWEQTGEQIMQPLPEPAFVRFCYSDRDPLTHNARVSH
ncbi:MAG: B12-binding domain-containing radical SAM protein [Lachnospiraceae bacterium]|nr:B12-binding domain-containing radical SAM protein [Lachnospiraceae bacterium]